MAAFPRRGLSGPQTMPSLRGPPLCAEGQQVWFPLGWEVGPPLGQQPGPSSASAPAPEASSAYSSAMGTAGQDDAGSPLSPLRGQGPGRGLGHDRSSCQAPCGSVSPTVAEAGASIAPTLHPGALRLP